MYALAAVVLSVFTLGGGTAQDTPREHVETASGSSHTYRLTLGGVMDGTTTLSPIGYSAPIGWFEPMRSVLMENTGDVDVVNPWIHVNGKRRWRTAKDILKEALETYGDPSKMSDGEKARAIWEYERHHRFHATTYDREVNDPVKVYNVYGYTLCGDEAPVLMDLWRLAGFKVRRGFPTGHVVSEVWYDGAWHLMDSDEHIICLMRDNTTIAGEADVVRDHDLMKRTHSYGILAGDSRKTDEFSASLYVHDGAREGEHPSTLGHTMNLTLRPGEALEWRWAHVGKHHFTDTHLREGWSGPAWARLRNGRWSYSPPLRRASARRGVHSSLNVRWSEKEGEPPLAPEKPGEPAWVVWEIRAPYVMVGGTLTAAASAGTAFSISFDAKQWKEVAVGSLDAVFPNKGRAHYRYFLKADLAGGLEKLTVENDLQMAPLSLPSLELGENAISYSDETREPHTVRITTQWVERSGPPVPAAPAAAVAPRNGGEHEGTRVRFEWTPVEGREGTKVVDYRFQLSDRSDLKWVLSSNFDKIISNTSDRGKPRYTLPDVGLLNPGQRYYWRVRAKDDRHAWGPWSAVWSFVAQGPGVPLQVRWEEGDLVWSAGGGRKPVKFLVYASNEKGFTASDKDYPVFAGNQKSGGLFPGREFVTFPANRIAEVTEPRHALRPMHAFYRVVAVDEKGERSGVSDVLAARRPFVYTDPPLEYKAGGPYRYEAKTIASIGDLRCRTIGNECYNAAFWDAEKPVFKLIQGPAWLTMDAASGVLSGAPPADAQGDIRVIVGVEIPRVGSTQQEYTLKPGK